MDFQVINQKEKESVKNALQNIYDAAEKENNKVSWYIIDELIKINEALNIEILM